MATQISRNAPCSCGSGKKYKKCCLLKSSTKTSSKISQNSSHDNKWLETQSRLMTGVFLPYLHQNQVLIEGGEYAYMEFLYYADQAAKQDFQDLPEGLDTELFYQELFLPWMMYFWSPCDHFDKVKGFDRKQTIASNFLASDGKRLSSEEKLFIQKMQASFLSFYSVLESTSENTLLVKDLLLGKTHKIQAHTSKEVLQRGDIVCARLLTLDEQNIFVGVAPTVFFPKWHNKVIDFRLKLMEDNGGKPLSAECLCDILHKVLVCFFFMLLEHFNPCNRFVNEDKEDYVSTKNFFTLDLEVEEAFRLLQPLLASENPEPYLESAERDETGKIFLMQFPWLESKKTSSEKNKEMGTVMLWAGKLMLEVNSKERSEKGKALLQKYLGESICFYTVTTRLADEDFYDSMEGVSEKIEDEWRDAPKLRAELVVMMKTNWEKWLDDKKAVFGEKTPREAAKTEIGREKLEGIFLQCARYDDKRKPEDPLRTDFDFLRAELNMPL